MIKVQKEVIDFLDSNESDIWFMQPPLDSNDKEDRGIFDVSYTPHQEE